MRKSITILFAAVLSVSAAFAQYRSGNEYGSLYDSENMAAFKSHVREIASAVLEGRAPGSEGEKEAAAYVEKQLAEYGVDLLSPAGGDVFGIRTETDTITSRNVVGFVQGYDSKLKDEFIVVAARLDNLGTMTMTVDGKPVEKIYYGANGNASGLSIMLELARMVQTNSILFRRSVLFIAFGSSTHSYAGAWYFLNRTFSETEKIKAMINLDMLGTGYNGFYAYTASNADMNAILNSLAGELQPVCPEIVASEPYPSDHRAFYSHNIPSVMFTTGRYTQHDTDRDTESILDYEMMERELEYIYNCTLALANTNNPPEFRKDFVTFDGKNDSAVPHYECDERPSFLGSSEPRRFLEKWVYQYLKYPKQAVLEGIQGRVTVEFIIEKDGNVSNVRVVKGVSEELDAEAVKVVSASPKWTPGKVGGKKVRTSMSIPIDFILEKKGKSSFGIKK